jgi:hypothetical protein
VKFEVITRCAVDLLEWEMWRRQCACVSSNMLEMDVVGQQP